jgi:hypothetical protein
VSTSSCRLDSVRTLKSVPGGLWGDSWSQLAGACQILQLHPHLLREADCSFLAKKYRSLCCHAARLCGHFHGRHPQVRHRVAVCTRLARPRVPTSTTTTLSDIRRPGAVRKQPLTTTQALISRLVQEEASYAVKIGNDNSHNTPTDFISTSTAFIAQPLTA